MKTHVKPIEIIFTDDDEDDLGFFREALLEVERPTRLTTFRSCESLLEHFSLLKGPRPDILFLDINMPGMDGISCLHEIRKNPRYSSLPIIIFTGSFKPLDVEESYLWGANMYLKKPSGFTELVNTVKKLFSDPWYGRLVDFQTHKYVPVKSAFTPSGQIQGASKGRP